MNIHNGTTQQRIEKNATRSNAQRSNAQRSFHRRQQQYIATRRAAQCSVCVNGLRVLTRFLDHIANIELYGVSWKVVADRGGARQLMSADVSRFD